MAKEIKQSSEQEEIESSMQSSKNPSEEFASNSGRTLRAIHPLGMRVVVRIRRDTNMTDSGLYLPEGAKQEQQASLIGEVLEVASAHDEESDEETNISGIPEGALVLIGKDVGVCIPWDEDLRVVETKDVLALIEEVDLN